MRELLLIAVVAFMASITALVIRVGFLEERVNAIDVAHQVLPK